MDKIYRNHPCIIGTDVINDMKVFIPFVLFVLFKFNIGKLIMLCILTVLLILKNLLKWRNTKFSIKQGMVNYEIGIISKKKISIPIDKITTIDISENIFESIFNTKRVKIDSGSVNLEKDDSEIKMVLKKDLALYIRKCIRNSTEKNYKYDDEVKESFEVSTKDLFISAITRNNLGFGIGLLFAANRFSHKIDDVLEIDLLTKISNHIDMKSVYKQSVLYLLYFVVGITILFLILSIILSIVGTVIKYYGFKVYKSNDCIVVEYGLINKKSYSLPIESIHAIKLKQNFIKQKFKLYRIEVSTVGYGDESGEEAIIFPIANKEKTDIIINTLLPEFNYKGQINEAPKEARIKFMFLPILVTLIICIVTSIIKIEFSFIFIILPIVILSRYLNYKNVSIGFDENLLVSKYGGFSKEITLVKVKSVQSITMSSNYFQRKKDLCTYKIDFYSNVLTDLVVIKHLKNYYFRKLEEKIDF